MSISSAVIPVAGLGTRLFPATKCQPKEMLPVGRKPVVQYVVEELREANISKMLFITGRKKRPIEDHFDPDVDLIEKLKKQGKHDLVKTLEFENMDVGFFYVRQSEQLGLGHAVLQADFFAHEPFVVALGDCIIRGCKKPSLVERLIQCFQELQASAVIAFHEVPPGSVRRYGIADPVPGDTDKEVFRLQGIVEKPSPEKAPSRLAVCARYVFSPEIFKELRETPRDAHGEIQLTDAIQKLIEAGHRVYGLRLRPGEKRFDIGNFQAYFESFIEFALTDPELGPSVRAFVKDRLEQIQD